MKKNSALKKFFVALLFAATIVGEALAITEDREALASAENREALASTCVAPWGMPVAEGQFVVAYYEDRATGGRRCQSEMRFCNNGFLSGFYRYQSCTEDLGCNEFPWGYIPHLSSVTAYRNSIESGGRRCESEIRYCSYGRLSGWFTNQTCTAF